MERREARGGTLVIRRRIRGQRTSRELLKRHGATIVSLENFMLYTPLLPEAASGTLEPRHVVVPLREMCPHAELLLGDTATIATAHGRSPSEPLAGQLEIGYERLVVALGARTRRFPCPGLAPEHGIGFKNLADAIALRNRVLLQLERASDPRRRSAAELGFVFVGAGYAGVEALAELNDLVRTPRSARTRRCVS